MADRLEEGVRAGTEFSPEKCWKRAFLLRFFRDQSSKWKYVPCRHPRSSTGDQLLFLSRFRRQFPRNLQTHRIYARKIGKNARWQSGFCERVSPGVFLDLPSLWGRTPDFFSDRDRGVLIAHSTGAEILFLSGSG